MYPRALAGGSEAVRKKDTSDQIGLCVQCRHAEVLRNARGSVFYLCQLSRTDARFPKYPRLPVLICEGHEPMNEEETRGFSER
jgi:hypothetical protein